MNKGPQVGQFFSNSGLNSPKKANENGSANGVPLSDLEATFITAISGIINQGKTVTFDINTPHSPRAVKIPAKLIENGELITPTGGEELLGFSLVAPQYTESKYSEKLNIPEGFRVDKEINNAINALVFSNSQAYACQATNITSITTEVNCGIGATPLSDNFTGSENRIFPTESVTEVDYLYEKAALSNTPYNGYNQTQLRDLIDGQGRLTEVLGIKHIKKWDINEDFSILQLKNGQLKAFNFFKLSYGNSKIETTHCLCVTDSNQKYAAINMSTGSIITDNCESISNVKNDLILAIKGDIIEIRDQHTGGISLSTTLSSLTEKISKLPRWKKREITLSNFHLSSPGEMVLFFSEEQEDRKASQVELGFKVTYPDRRYRRYPKYTDNTAVGFDSIPLSIASKD